MTLSLEGKARRGSLATARLPQDFAVSPPASPVDPIADPVPAPSPAGEATANG